MRWLLLTLLLACEPAICLEPCQGQSASEERGAGIVCICNDFAAVFAWTMDPDVCAADRAWWAKHAPLPCAQPGGGTKRAQP